MSTPTPSTNTFTSASAYYYSSQSFTTVTILSLLYSTASNICLFLLKPTGFRLEQKHCISDSSPYDESKDRPVAIVTGANTGIGLYTSLHLVRKGYIVILACRSRERGEKAVEFIRSTTSPNKGEAAFLHPLDLSSLASVRSFAREFQSKYSRLDVLVNNAGINTSGVSQDGLDLCFQTNFLGHFLLTRLLLPSVTEGGRIVNLSSVMHHFSRNEMSEDDMTSEQWWKESASPRSSNTYAISKLAAILFSLELNKRMGDKGIRAISVNPGAVNSDIWRAIPPFLLNYVVRPIFRLVFLTSDQGSFTSVIAATSNDLPKDAIYLQPYALPSTNKYPFPMFEMLGPFVGCRVTPPRLPGDLTPDCSEALWNACEKLVHLEKN